MVWIALGLGSALQADRLTAEELLQPSTAPAAARSEAITNPIQFPKSGFPNPELAKRTAHSQSSPSPQRRSAPADRSATGTASQSPTRTLRLNRPDQPSKPRKVAETPRYLGPIQAQPTAYFAHSAGAPSRSRTTEQAREQIRARLLESRDRSASRQREALSDLRKENRDLRDRLADHREVLESARAFGQEAGKGRKGGE